MALGETVGRESSTDQVVFEGNPLVKKVILNRPSKLNTLNHEMLCLIKKRLKDYENDSTVKLVIWKANGKAFCAGGDVVDVYKFMTTGHRSFGATLFNKFFTLEYLIATYKKPLVALIDGILMGGGARLSMVSKFKIVTENTVCVMTRDVFAMPEAALGSNGGISYFFSRLSGYFGEYLGLTGAKIDGADMIACGLATHFVLSKDLQLLENALDKVDSSDSNAISQLISKFTHKPNMKQHAAYSRLHIVNKCFCGETVEDIVLALEKQKENEDEKWIVDAINSMKASSPIGLKVSLRSIREGRKHSFKECLVRDYTTYGHILERTVSNDVFEGIRTKLLEKNANPKWQPSKLQLVTKEMVDRYFDKVDEEDWKFLNFHPKLNLVDINVVPISKL